MKHVNIKSFDIPDAWYQCISTIWKEGDFFIVGHGSEETETKKLNVTVEITNPEHRPLIDEKAPSNMNYINEYFLRYLFLDARQSDEHYTYGSRMRSPVDQIEGVIKRIVENPKDRQLTVVVRRPYDILKFAPVINGKQIVDEKGNPVKWSPPCLTILDFEVLDEVIHMTGYFRSWDVVGGFPDNLAALQLLLEGVVSEVNKRSGLEYRSGKQIWSCKNLHIYKRLYLWVEEFVTVKPRERMVKQEQKKESETE